MLVEAVLCRTYWLAAGLEQVREFQPKTTLVLPGLMEPREGAVLRLWPGQLRLTRTEWRMELPPLTAPGPLESQSSPEQHTPSSSAQTQTWQALAERSIPASRNTQRKGGPVGARGSEPQGPCADLPCSSSQARHAAPFVIQLVRELPRVRYQLVLLSF